MLLLNRMKLTGTTGLQTNINVLLRHSLEREYSTDILQNGGTQNQETCALVHLNLRVASLQRKWPRPRFPFHAEEHHQLMQRH